MQRAALEYLRTGVSHFFRLPPLAEAAATPGAVLLGVPYDLGSTHHPGSRFAPWAVRSASVTVGSWHPTRHLDVFATLGCVDGGNIVFPPFAADLVRAEIARHVQALSSTGSRPFLVGGDHSITLPVARGLRAVHGALAIIHVDAHLDTSPPDTWAEEHHHGTPLRHCLTEGLVSSLQQVGVRAPWQHAEEGALAARHGAHSVSIEDVAERGAADVAAELRERVGKAPVYLSFDVDAVDPAFAPGTGTQVPGGLSSREALALVRGLAGINLVGMDVVEVCPALDVGEQTSLLAAYLLFEGLGVAAHAVASAAGRCGARPGAPGTAVTDRRALSGAPR